MSSDETYGYRNGGYGDDTGYQDHENYGGRNSRRAEREPSGPKKASAGTAAAILIFAAILGFGGGAIAANSGGDGDDPPAAGLEDGTDSPSDDNDNSDGEDGPEDNQDEAVPGEGISLSSPADGSDVANNEDGRFTLEGSTNPTAANVELTVERSLDGGDTWGDAGSSRLTTTTRDDGTFETTLWSGRPGANLYRVVGEGPDGPLVSNVITVNVVEDE